MLEALSHGVWNGVHTAAHRTRVITGRQRLARCLLAEGDLLVATTAALQNLKSVAISCMAAPFVGSMIVGGITASSGTSSVHRLPVLLQRPHSATRRRAAGSESPTPT